MLYLLKINNPNNPPPSRIKEDGSGNGLDDSTTSSMAATESCSSSSSKSIKFNVATVPGVISEISTENETNPPVGSDARGISNIPSIPAFILS